MKKIIIYCASILLFTSCANFLDEENKAGINNNDLYKTEVGYETLRVNAYSKLRIIYQESPMLLLAGTDLYQMPRGVTINGIYDYYNLYETNGTVLDFYKKCYEVLQAVNTAEHYLSIADISEEKKNLYQAEYDFMNGFLHFLLVEQFGGIVINDEFTQNPRLSMPRVSLEDSYKHVIDRLEKAAKSAALPQTKNDGSICQDVVNHYLSKVYLTRGWDLNKNEDFSTSKSYAEKVFAARGNALKFKMEDLWSPKNENNQEFLFAIQYDAKSIASKTEGNNQEALFGPYLGGTERSHKYMAQELSPSWALHSWFGEDDARYEATFMLHMWEYYFDYYNPEKSVFGKNAVSAIYPRVWGKDKAKEMFDDYAKLTKGIKDGGFVDISMTVPGKDDKGNSIQVLTEGALEFLQKWYPAYFNVAPIAAVDAKGNNYLKIYPFINCFDSQMENEDYWRTGYVADFAQPCIKKFDNGQLTVFHSRQSTRDIVLATLSETLLLYAEASIALGDYATAEQYINTVLSRPGNSKSGATLTCSLPTSKEQALEVYLKESGKELAGQYCGRWPELRRTKMLKTMYYKYNYDYLTGNYGQDPIGEKLYRPIPERAISLNEALSSADQNPGY